MLEEPEKYKNDFARYIFEQREPLGELKIGRFFDGKSIKIQEQTVLHVDEKQALLQGQYR
ncbi:hypothetical protein [Kiloniella sp. EL199]|uniref:hypothetical protein n=1 Tax=Kiloniella sp. EL199 TaxID=2107581 RepID=UPI000EA1CC7A|nr:hypothetical protein [Kiloniella sp. EL199]